jgi:hypothetical protein
MEMMGQWKFDVNIIQAHLVVKKRKGQINVFVDVVLNIVLMIKMGKMVSVMVQR